MFRSLRHRATLSAATMLIAATAANAQSLTYLGQQVLLPVNSVPVGTGSFFGNEFAGTLVGGLSGIDRLTNGTYAAISDDRSQSSPARFYDLSIDLTQFQRSNMPGASGVVFNNVTTIQTPNGTPFSALGVDPEGLRVNASGNFYWSNEGQRSAAGFQNPTLREMTTLGQFVREFAVPARYNPIGSTSGNTPGDVGIRNNLAFESVALSPNGQQLYVATENALAQDGAAAGVGIPSVSRVIEFNAVGGGAPNAEFAYNTEPVAVAPSPAGGFATNGLVEMLALGDRQFIAVERSFSAGVGNSIRLYFADARNATDVSSFDTLSAGGYAPMSKQLLLDLGTIRNDDNSLLILDNIEGITWGPTLANGNPTLLLVSDNNFSATQFTQFIALEVTGPIPEPSEYAMLLLGLGALGWKLRRARRRMG